MNQSPVPIDFAYLLRQCCAVAALMIAGWTSSLMGQSLDVPQTRMAPITPNPIPSFDATMPGVSGVPATIPGAVPGGAQGFVAPSLSNPPIGSQYDPYAAAPSVGIIQPSQSGTLFGGMFGTPPQPSYTPYGATAPIASGPSAFGGGSYLGGPVTVVPQAGLGTFSSPGTYGAPTGYGVAPSALPNGAPSTLFPGGIISPTQSFSPTFNPYRLIQRGRFRHTFLYRGSKENDLGINDTDVAFAFAFPRFLWSTQPLFIAPSFSLHLWDGPVSSSGADLPANAYSAFLDFGWQSDPNRMFGGELGVNVGSYSQFSVFRSSESIRIRGKGLGAFRLTPATTFKLGIYYYHRVRIKLLPAGGFIWRPNPYTKLDLFFPQPKFSRYISTVGTQDVWWYLSADYGGGAWTINRADGREDQVDVNDIRLMLGLEWGLSEKIRNGLRTAFFEFGYVGGRELVYRHNPQDNLKLRDTWMFRIGLGY